MCWTTPSGETCRLCLTMFALCKHESAFKNEHGNLECVYCNALVVEVEKVNEELDEDEEDL